MHFRTWSTFLLGATMALAFAGTVVAAETVITSDRLEKRTESDGDHFFFYDNVRIVATNLVATCDLMEVITAGIADQKASVAQFGAIEVIIARGDVRIEQASLSRTARADAAEIFPQKGEVVLTGNAEVTDAQGTVRGHRMRLVKGEEHAIVEGSAEGERPKVILPMIPDWDRIKPKNDHQNKAVGAPEGATQGEKALEVPDQPQPQDTL